MAKQEPVPPGKTCGGRTMVRFLRMVGLLALGMLPPLAWAVDPAPKAIDQVGGERGSGESGEREQGSAALEKVVEPALPAVRKVAGSKDAEVRSRAPELKKKALAPDY